ncbi:MAG: hypothetical protein P1U88_12775 [Thalassobaculaceae bacterium]|nr:hypothetical protein [Thalassobaculaceae bacterium]
MSDNDNQTKCRPTLRLVAANRLRFRPLMPLRELERRLAGIERRLRCAGTPPQDRASQLLQRDLIAAILATRLLEPARARRIEQKLRWLSRHDDDRARPETVFARIGHWMRAVLSHGGSSSVAA